MIPSEIATPASLGSPQFKTIECGAFLVTDALFPAAHNLAKHFHDRAVVGIPAHGEWDSVLGNTRLQNVPGMLHVEPAGESHANQFGSQGSHVVLIQPDPAESTVSPAFKALLETAHQV